MQMLCSGESILSPGPSLSGWPWRVCCVSWEEGGMLASTGASTGPWAMGRDDALAGRLPDVALGLSVSSA